MRLKLYEAITEKGASNWLNAMPLKDHDFYLNKQTFWDTINLRYGIPLPRLPMKCVWVSVWSMLSLANEGASSTFVTTTYVTLQQNSCLSHF